MRTARPCPCCGRQPVCNASYLVTCRCPNCYDGTEDASSSAQLCGWGETASQAVAAWNELVEGRE
jgi:hypothetical protein